MNDLMNPFGQPKEAQNFDKSRFPSPHQNVFAHGHLARLKSLKPLTTGHLSLKKMACSVRVSLVLCVTMNVCAVNISA